MAFQIRKGLSAVLLVTAMLTTMGTTSTDCVSSGSAFPDTSDISRTDYLNKITAENYSFISSRYTAAMYSGDVIEIPVNNSYIAELSGGKLVSDNKGYRNDVIELSRGECALFSVNVPETALYWISFDYYPSSDSILPVKASLSVNGRIPFYEAQNLVFESTWIDKKEKSYDRYGNEIVSSPEKLPRWEKKFVMDGSYRYSAPFAFELKKGENIIELNITEGAMLLGNIYLSGETKIPDYSKQEAMDGDRIIIIEAERIDYRNDSSIRATCEFNTALTPYDASKKVLNVIDAASFKDAGQTVSYEFLIDEPGCYYMGFVYRQSDKTDFPVFLDIRIDGEIPNRLLKSYPFKYTKDYTNLTLTDNDGEPVALYLDKGRHTISLTISIDNIRHALETTERIISGINDLALEITKVAGRNKDKYRDLDLVNYIPDVRERLLTWADELDGLRNDLRKHNPKVKEIGALSYAKIAAESLRRLAREPNRIPYRIDELAQSTNSAVQYLANFIDILKDNRLAIDKIYIYQKDAKLPEGIGFFKSIYLSIARFFSSFADQAYSASNKDESHLQVWVNRSRQHVELLQKMIDESFTPKTGIKVDVSIMPDQGKLIMANAAGDAPDVAQSVNYSVPFELAIRGALKDITEFGDFREVLTRFADGLHIPAMIGDGIYAVPETINFWVLFYRTDILEKLGLEIPETVEDVKRMLPELQIRGMNFYYPTAGMGSFKNFHGTTPLIFQYGGSLYGRTADNTALNSERTVQGFTELTELFTIYNLPVEVPSFYQRFRNGSLPIGIAEYGMYNLLINAAPEIAGNWDIAVVPGIVNENGEIVRYTSGGAESCVIFRSTEEREKMAWEYIKWWTSKEVQVEYGQTLQITYGPEYIWNTANLEAFAELPWDAKHKAVIIEQTKWVLEAPRLPGSYMTERELSNAFNAVVVDGRDLRITLNTAVKRINRETERKLKEFGYMSHDGKMIKEYEVPTLEKVRRILYGEN
ncbi:ABC transporter substrate-binding protein [Thermoclostridium stercorarium subsp. leptospartum DSM 9219]|uniref:ABC transporter substrate-binding protein n=2 Tax=Thermoclostridium stercorarium TaxID=1510 RepID=A0A1B1YJS9_THEST|nr:extracellular solute-binding protein [Thermoclostridium stercorarium]ANX01027.1 ABC transporter substrate-binding protein [Thermoclostridium stercorarium subsp. leptospartum DSM 9219]